MHRIKKNALFLIDGSYILYRSYYALRPLTTSTGIPTQATYAFCRTIKKLIDKFEPTQMVLVWDSKGPTFRKKMYSDYKATRTAPPSDLFIQKEHIEEFANIIELYQISKKGYEADDIIYALSQKEHNTQKIIVGSDKDLFQMLNKHEILIFDPFKEILIDEEDFKKEKGFSPSKLPFYHSLVGDSSDNIPGVKGIGKKGATELVKQFDSLKDLYDHLDKVKKEKTRDLLKEGRKDAFMSLDLFLLKPPKISFNKKDAIFKKENWIKAAPFFQKMEFKTLLAELEKIFGKNKVEEYLEKGGYKKIKRKKKTTTKEPEEKQQTINFEKFIQGSPGKWKYKIIVDEKSLIDLIKKIKQKKEYALDTETTGLKPLQDNLVGISLAYNKKNAFYLPLHHTGKDFEKQLNPEIIYKHLKKVLESKTIKAILHNSKFDHLVLWTKGINLSKIDFDCLIAANLLRIEGETVNLKDLSYRYIGEKMKTFKEVLGKKYKTFAEVPLKDAANYAAHDALQTYKLKYELEKKLKKEKKLYKIFKHLEMPLIPVLISMEKIGIKVNVKILKKLEKSVKRKLKQIEEKISAAIKIPKHKEINLNSPKQLEKLLFDKLGLPVVKKTSTGQRSTDQEVLEKLSNLHPIPQMILHYRELHKLLNTYIEPLQKDINPATGRIHTSFNQILVATGRLSSSKPNLQNIPAASPIGRKIRSAFVAPRGRHFLSADYSQMELRILAHVTKDKNLKNAFKEGIDIHKQTASQLFDKPVSKITEKERQLGKKINYSIIYGLSEYGLAKDLDIKPSEAQKYIDKYFEKYSGVAKWIEKSIKEAKKKGYVETLMGRRRYLPGLKEKNKNLFEAAKRAAINTPMQGSGAEIMKKAMINIYNKITKRKLDAAILLQIHDELIIEYNSKEEKKIKNLVKKCMEKVVNWDIPFEVSLRTGKNWEDVTK